MNNPSAPPREPGRSPAAGKPEIPRDVRPADEKAAEDPVEGPPAGEADES